MASVKAILRTDQENKNGLYTVIIQILHNRKKKNISLNHFLSADQWDPQKERAIIKKTESKEQKLYLQKLNSTIGKRIGVLNQAIIELDEKGISYTLDMILSCNTKQYSSISFFTFTEDLISRLEKQGKRGNARTIKQALNVFKSYRKDKDLSFEEFNYKVLIDFEEHLSQKANKVNTIFTYMRKLKSTYNKAIKEGIVKLEYSPFQNYKIKTEKTTKRAITKDNIKAIKALDLSLDETLFNARNLFLFSFYARGISFVDIAHLKVKDITNDRLNYTRNKTNQKFSIRITQPMFEIIFTYNDLKVPESFLFPIIKNDEEFSYQQYLSALRLTNKKLKIIGKMIGLSVPLTTYVSRHSWATIAKRSGIPTAVISEGLGHETERTTQIYLDSFENQVLDDANDLITNI
ncbi:MAG: phage integrase SAM-like domain-containing protein [Prolixibacteraceae bacterium]